MRLFCFIAGVGFYNPHRVGCPMGSLVEITSRYGWNQRVPLRASDVPAQLELVAGIYLSETLC